MPRFLPIDAKQHRNHGWLPYTGYDFAVGDVMVPLVADELAHALPILPLAFRRRDTGGEAERASFELVAVQSLSPNLNLFVHPDGRWLGGYIPAHYRGYPFRLLPMPENKRLALCIDADSGLLVESAEAGGESFFDDEGKPTEALAGIMNFHEKLEKRRRLTQLAVEVLAQNALIVPWEIKTKGDDDEPHRVEGLYRIDEGALNALSTEALGKVRRAGGLALAYAQLFSQHRLPALARLYRLRQDFGNQAPDLETLFGDEDDISFDFDS